MTDKWPLWVIERYYDGMGWITVDDSLSDKKHRAYDNYSNYVGRYPRWWQEDEEAQDGDCRLRRCRIELKPIEVKP